MSPSRGIRIVIADDHPIVREGLRRYLQGEPEFAIVGEAADGSEALRLVRTLNPDVLLMDLAMPRMGGLEVLRALSIAGQAAPRSILLTASIRNDEVVQAMQLGVRGIVLKDAGSAILLKCIRAVMAGQCWFGRSMVDSFMEAVRSPTVPAPARLNRFGLTPRQVEIVAAVAMGLTNKEIASRLTVSEDTVKHHLTHIFDKLGVSTRVELALFATRNELGGG
jgi:two-component system, NarL family, nitrate/nitrite response regulator NarL